MGEHGTWFDFLYRIEALRPLLDNARHYLAFEHTPLGEHSHFTLTHVFVALVVMLFIILGAASFKAAMSRGGEAALVPPRTLTLRNFFEILCDGMYDLTVGVMGEKEARRFFPFIGSLGIFILFCNLMALIPGFAPATDTLKTNLALAALVFLATHFYGVKEHGFGYLRHFMGPLLWLAPMMIIIELISHIARPISLSLRLMGNMAADHKVIFSFFALVPILVPVPFFFLGILVCVVQALVFCLLSMVYLSMAVAHDH